MKRGFLFLAAKLAMVLMLSITVCALGVEWYLHAQGLNLTLLPIFAVVIGFAASFLSPKS